MHKVFLSFHNADLAYKAELLDLNRRYPMFADGSVDTGDISDDRRYVQAESQKGTLRSVPLALRRTQISRANSDRVDRGFARIRATASATAMVPPSPFMLITAFIQVPKLAAPVVVDGLY